MATEPAVSVIISTRDRAHYLPETLGTLAVQRGDIPFEVVVIDNGSTDATPDLLAEWCRRDPRFRTAREPRPGLSRGKNAGIRLARAPLLLFTDDDMQIDPGWVDSYHRLFARHGEEPVAAGGPIVPVPHDLGEWPEWLTEPALADAGLLDHREQRPLGRFEYVWGGNMAVPRRVFERLGPWDETVGLQGEERVEREDSAFFEDTELQDRIRAAGGRVWFCPGAVVRHRVDRGAVTPRRVVSTAFARGRNDVWVRSLPVWHEVRSIPRRNALRCLAALGTSLVAWGLCAVLFRVTRRRSCFEGARRAAFRSGGWLDSLRAGRESARWYRAAARLVFPLRAALLRMTPGAP